jgi:hypothetical protein
VFCFGVFSHFFRALLHARVSWHVRAVQAQRFTCDSITWSITSMMRTELELLVHFHCTEVIA